MNALAFEETKLISITRCPQICWEKVLVKLRTIPYSIYELICLHQQLIHLNFLIKVMIEHNKNNIVTSQITFIPEK